MKPAAFTYAAPTRLDEALEAMVQYGDEAKVLAGGQSLVPAMNFRLARPAALVDINLLEELDYVTEVDGSLRIGALARHARFEQPVTADPIGVLMADAARYIGHEPIRVRGTFCGSLAHADPAAEWPLLFAALDGEAVVASTRGRKVIPAGEFHKTVFTTSLEPDELLVEARMPLLGPDGRVGFVETSKRAGDFAIVAVAAALVLSEGRIEDARLAFGGVGGTPVRGRGAEAALIGREASPEAFEDAAGVATREVEPMGDIHGSSDYRRHLVSVLTFRALERCLPPASGD